MQILYASDAMPGRINEDFVITGPTWAVVLDGASPHPDADTGCVHNVAWYVRQLGTQLARQLTLSPARPLDDTLASAIAAVRQLHDDTCDLSNPDSPSATVVTVRQHDDQLDYLILADSPLIIDTNHEIRAITDDRTAHLTDYTPEGVRAARNIPGGFYVASTLPDAAYQAVRGTLPTPGLHRAALLSDGAARLVERFAIIDWPELLQLLTTHGPAELIRRTREAERAETADERATRRGKPHDDATAVLVTELDRTDSATRPRSRLIGSSTRSLT